MLVDQKILKALIDDLGAEAYQTLISIFIEEVSETIETIKKSLNDDDYSTLSLNVHSMKSVCGTYGAVEAFELSKELNDRFKSGESINTLEDDIKKLINILEETVSEFKQIDANGLM